MRGFEMLAVEDWGCWKMVKQTTLSAPIAQCLFICVGHLYHHPLIIETCFHHWIPQRLGEAVGEGGCQNLRNADKSTSQLTQTVFVFLDKIGY